MRNRVRKPEGVPSTVILLAVQVTFLAGLFRTKLASIRQGYDEYRSHSGDLSEAEHAGVVGELLSTRC